MLLLTIFVDYHGDGNANNRSGQPRENHIRGTLSSHFVHGKSHAVDKPAHTQENAL